MNDIMPMIGARFYTQLDASQLRNDLLENELAKVGTSNWNFLTDEATVPSFTQATQGTLKKHLKLRKLSS